MNSIFEDLENVIWEDAGGRGIISFAQRGELKKAATSLLTANHVIIVTGFYIEKTQSGETDGPLGAIFLARALEQLGIKVSLLTSSFNSEILHYGVEEIALSCNIVVVDKGEESIIFPELLTDSELTHIIAVEQMGSAIDGKYYNMIGTDLSYSTARFDSLFLLASEKGIITIGIGDGGNEIGMGKLFSSIYNKVEYGWISCITPVDYLIVAGISNWGAYGLIAGLCCLTRRPLLHNPEQEKGVLEAVVRAGAVDGRTLESSMSVDALPISKHIEVLNKLGGIANRPFGQVYNQYQK
jgi:hypothetical protein